MSGGEKVKKKGSKQEKKKDAEKKKKDMLERIWRAQDGLKRRESSFSVVVEGGGDG